ncbi:MAG: 6-hydroxynicotinate reductase [Acidimicrobiales bacterium]
MTQSSPSILGGNPEDDHLRVRCEACPVRCFIRPSQTGSCDRYGNNDGVLVRIDPVTIIDNALDSGRGLMPVAGADGWSGEFDEHDQIMVTGIGAGTTYPDYKPAPFIVSQVVDGVDTVTVVTEGIFSYCGVKVKIDTDRHLGAERSLVRYEDHPIGHVTSAEYGSQMLSLGGVHHLTGGTRHEGLATMNALLALCEREAVQLEVDDGASLLLRAGDAPIVDGEREELMRIGCGSATVGIFAQDWAGLVDEVVVVDEHITGVLSEHQAGNVLGMPRSGIKLHGRRSTPGRFFSVAKPGRGWGGTDLEDPLAIIDHFKPGVAWAGLKMLMVSTTGQDAALFELDDDLVPIEIELTPEISQTVDRIGDNCEPARTSVIFIAGAGGSLRAGVTRSPLSLTHAIHDNTATVTCGGAPVYLWPGGGITLMVDVEQLPPGSFGYVPTPALVAPLEFTMPRNVYLASGGHQDAIVPVDDFLERADVKRLGPK